MEKIYVSGALSSLNPKKVKQNIIHATEEVYKLIEKGFCPICPHAMGWPLAIEHTFKEGVDKIWEQCNNIEYKDWLFIDLKILDMCDSIYMLKGWEESKGALLEYTYAKKIGLDILFEK